MRDSERYHESKQKKPVLCFNVNISINFIYYGAVQMLRHQAKEPFIEGAIEN